MARYTDKLEYIPPLIVAHFKACYIELATNKRQTDYLAIGLRCTPDQPFRFSEIKASRVNFESTGFSLA